MVFTMPYGYGTAIVTEEQLKQKQTFYRLHPEMQRRFLALSKHLHARGVPLGVGTGWRIQPANKPGFAKPGNSWHEGVPVESMENALAIDTVPSSSWAAMEPELAAFGLRSFRNVNNEPWHCLPLDQTDVLTMRGWVPLAEAIVTMPDVASFGLDSGRISFNRPLAAVPPRDEDVIMLRDGSEATAEHRIPVRGQGEDAWKMMTYGEVDAVQTRRMAPCGGWFDGTGVDLSHDELRFLAWVQGDGSIRGDGAIEFQFKRRRKIDRLASLLDGLGVSYYRKLRPTGVTRFIVHANGGWRADMLSRLDGKSFAWWMLAMSSDQRRAVLDELPHVDGQHQEGRSDTYWTTDRQSADVVQALLHLHNGDGTVRTYDRETTFGASTSFMVTLAASTTTPYRIVGSDPQSRRPDTIGTRRTTVSCLTTVDDTLVIRQRGRVYVVGNCQPIEIPTSRRYATTLPPLKVWDLPGDPPPQEDDDMRTLAKPRRIYDSRKTGGPFTVGESREITVGMTTEAFVNVTAIGQNGSTGYISVNDPTGGTSIVNYSGDDRVDENSGPVLTPNGKIVITNSVGVAHVAVDVMAEKP